MPDDPDNVPTYPHRPKLDRGIGGPFEPGEQSACNLDGKHYPEGSVMIVEGRPATCKQGKWIGDGDDPPFKPRRPDFLDSLESSAD